MSIILCIYLPPNNVKTCQKLNETGQTANLCVLTRGSHHKELQGEKENFEMFFSGLACFVFMTNFRFHSPALHVFSHNICKKMNFIENYLQFYTSQRKYLILTTNEQKQVDYFIRFLLFLFPQPGP